MYWILWILGGAALLYYAACVRYAGRKASYLWIWLAAGIVLTLSGGGLYLLDCRGIVLPVWFMAAAAGSAAAVLLLFGILLVWIGKGMREQPCPDLDVLVVLGARVKGTRPSRALEQRLERAEGYLRRHPETWAILSGGQGEDEEISEAEAMYRYLAEAGIDSGRLIREDQSVTTVENLRFSGHWLSGREKIGIVTSDFHITRSLGIARKLGYRRVYGIPASSGAVLQFHYLVRESFALLKDKLAGNL